MARKSKPALNARNFIEKFGEERISTIPTEPGVYRFYDEQDRLIYVGKAKNLRRRLSQYRNAKRRKKHYKMRAITQAAIRLEVEPCADHLAACLLEMSLIQTHRPKWNVEGAFFFLYPMIGLKFESGELSLCYTTQPELFEGYEFHGAFRSRDLTREAFFAIVELFMFVGHRSPRRKREKFVRFSHQASFRQLPPVWLSLWRDFFRGDSPEAMSTLILSLIENAGARKKKSYVQDLVDEIKRFWKHEALPLQRARKAMAYAQYPVSQKDRDSLFIRHRLAKSEGPRPTAEAPGLV